MNPRLQYLFNVYITKTATNAERNELWTAVKDAGYADTFQQLIGAEMENETSQYPISAEQANEIFLRVVQYNNQKTNPVQEGQPHYNNSETHSSEISREIIPVHRIHFLKTTWFKYAAAILIITGIGAYLWNNNLKVKTENSKTAKTDSSNEILPGGQRALLTLADGSTIILDSAANGQLATQGNSTIIKKDGIITYSEGRPIPSHGGVVSPNGETGVGSVQRLATNTMSTPRGGQYQLTLSDGTRVFLNAASSITYPTVFNNKTREVSITGEAYFEVAQNKSKPFIVHLSPAGGSGGANRDLEQNKDRRDAEGGLDITVLGTSFNVNAYPDETTKTSLAEGSIKINNKILKPGQAYINNQIISTNLAHDLAWKNNVFRFDSEDLPSILRQLSRWYDLDITNNTNIKSKFTGIISRNVNADEVLHMLEQTGKVHFKIEDRKIIVIN